ncbi:hypothetical protein BJF79_06480 [Actinomadura sp. CNU-125]|uniref:hypothetical protein n=1 Tax=Actinomadura sp. CNU-125 TaxID=1904961 RepID=UPI0009678CC1|nr:hypothetical protein [Actinomadura sp. CNU-125]OLT36263.1 hypothetical protein BJF79_06480 [Actinomadura sp. CNU-125]
MEHYWTAAGRNIDREIRDVSGIVSDYPLGEPLDDISVLTSDAVDAAKSAADHIPTLPVLGLVAVVPYLCWRSTDAALNARVREALITVAADLGGLPCPHGDGEHPGDSGASPDFLLNAMEELAVTDEDEVDLDEDERERWNCPKNLAALADDGRWELERMLAEDGEVARAGEGVYSPELKDIPDVFFGHVNGRHTILITKNERERPIYPKWLIRPLFRVVRRQAPWERPEDDYRGLLLWTARELRARPDGPTAAGLVLALSDAYTYAMSDDVPERAVRDELVEAFSEAHRVRRDATCAHAGEHPALDPEETLVAAAKLWVPDYTDEEVEARPVSAETVEAVGCPAHLRDIALRAATELRRDVAGRFGPSAGADLDARFLDEDGTLRADRVARDVRFHNAGPDPETSPAVWCARRVLAGVADPRERAALVLAVAHAAGHPHWYADLPGAVDVLAEALTAVTAADPGECGHTDGHTAGDVASYGAPVIGQLIPVLFDSLRYQPPPTNPERRPFVRPNIYRDEEGNGATAGGAPCTSPPSRASRSRR